MFGAAVQAETFPAEPPEREDSTYTQLRSFPPGLILAGAVSTVETRTRSGGEGVRYLQNVARQVAHYQALFYAAVAEVGDAVAEELGAESEDAHSFASDEIGAALAWNRRSADNHLALARDLLERLPDVWKALRAGTIDLTKARVICDHTVGLDEETAREVATKVLANAAECTPTQLRARLKRLAIEADPDAAEKEYAQAVEDRRVWVDANPDGTATLLALNVAPDRANAAFDHIDRLAQLVPPEGRTLDQIRADITLDLLEGRHLPYDHTGAGRGIVDIRVDLQTLMGLNERPAELAGWGPVVADIARQVAATQQHSEWRFTVTDGHQIECSGTTRRRPTERQRRRLQARYPTCVFPGCRRPAQRSDLDHRQAWAEGGATTDHNLAPLCRHHHRLKHEGGWNLERRHDGAHIWTSPLGLRYTTTPQAP